MAGFSGVAGWPRRWWSGVRELPKVEAILLVNTLVGCVGFGLYTAVSVIYFSTFADVSAVQVGLGFSLTASVWIFAAGPVGRLVDRIGPREMTIGAGAVQGILLACLPLINGVASFLILMCTLGIAERGASVSREALLAQLVDEKRRVVTAARSRSVANIGLSVGTALAGVALAVNTRTAFVVLLVCYALLTLGVSAISLQYPRVPGRRGTTRSGPRGVFRDPPFLAVSLLSGLVSIYDTVLVIGLPLWIAHHTNIPTTIFAGLIIANTLLIVLFQVRAARGVESVPDARRALVQGSLAAAFACAIFAVTAWTDTAVLAGAILAAGVLLLTAGELRAAAADWALRFELAHRDAQGEYGAIHSLGSTIRSICGPVLVTYLLSVWTDTGWFVLVVIFLALAAATGPVVGWAQRTRDRYTPAGSHPAPVPSATDGVADEPVPTAQPQGATR
ncbi:MFS transporter [Micromonospora sp. RTGN7]|uniref:MFS transporter n=1 Tax=Micromonospora sp. RTGN7 TaxID=3016526 RepID=UPI0029FF24CE|nr:MFS transporter [Micromonospora sp. RTGN7]